MSKLWVIPDIHGEYALLDSILSQLFNNEKLDLLQDKLIFTGDMIDRGKQSKEVVERIKQLKDAHPKNVVVLGGNHEWIAIDATLGKPHALDLWLANGGGATLQSFGRTNGRLDDDTCKWLAGLPLYHEEPGFFFSHAPAPREDERDKWSKGQPFTRHELTWTYDPDESYIAREHDNGVIGVCGHITGLRKGIKAPRFYNHYIFADAGSGYKDAPLCATEVRTQKVLYAWPKDVKNEP